MKRFIPLLFVLLLTACATVSAQSPASTDALPEPTQPTTKDVLIADLNAAIANDKLIGYTDGVNCWTAVLAHIQAAPKQSAESPTIKGFISAFEAARVQATRFKSASAAGLIPADVHTACAPVFVRNAAIAASLGVAVTRHILLPVGP